jgi:uncharacterized OB-fold protein
MAQWLNAEVVIPPNDPWHQQYFEQQSGGQLKLPKCSNCGLLMYPIRSMCSDCRSTDYTWEAVSGKGTIHSYYVLTEPIAAAFYPHPDAVIALVELDEQRGVGIGGDRTLQPVEDRALRMVCNILKSDGSFESPDNVAINKRVKVHIVDMGDGMGLPQFELSGEPSEGEEWQVRNDKA